MNVGQFLSTVLPSVGSWAVVLIMEDGKPVTRWYSAGDAANMMGFANWGVSRRANAYFAVASYTACENGEMRRRAQQAVFHRSLRLDIDCGESKPYPDKRSGWNALVSFVQAVGLPNPTVVDSGGGLHVYWPFDRDLPLEQWLTLANGLRHACEQHGFAVDHVVTVDAARILRLPETQNFKNGGARPVRMLFLSPGYNPDDLRVRLPYHGPSLVLGRGPSVNDELSAGRYPPYTLRDVLTGCPGMGGMLRTGGAYATEPLWKATLDLINKAEGSDEQKYRVARAVSQGHPTFTEEALAHKWNQVVQQDYHTPTCAKMAQLGMPECATCPLRAAIKSPASVGRVNAAALGLQPQTPVPAQAPAPAPAAPGQVAVPAPQYVQHGVFILGPTSAIKVVDGLISANLAIKDGLPHRAVDLPVDQEDGSVKKVRTWVPIIPFKIVEVERLLESMGKQMVVNITFDGHKDGLRRVSFTNQILHDAKQFSQTLGGAGLSVSSSAAKLLQDAFMPDFLTSLQKLRSANLISGRLGWTDDKSGFVLGSKLYTANGSEHVHPISGSAASSEMEGYYEAGDEAKLRDAITLAMNGSPERQAVVALSIATPLVEFTGIDGVILNAWSRESGIGKSTLCDAALAIWGDPNKLRKDYRDTANATWKLAAAIGNLPMVVDEFTNIAGAALSDYVYTVTQGREKHRLTSSAALNTNANRWRLAAITTANNSIHDKLLAYRPDAAAEAARVFELRLSPISVPPEQMAANKLTLLGLRSNFGHIGPKLIQLYLARPPEYWTEALNRKIEWWDREVAAGTTDRFRSACAALIEIGAQIGSALGLPFDVPAIKRVLQQQWESQTREFETTRRGPMDFVVDYITSNSGDFAVIGGISGNDLLTQGNRKWLGEIRGVTVDGKLQRERVIIPLNNLREWVREKNGNFRAFQDWLEAENHPGGCVERMGRFMFLQGQLQQVRTQVVSFRPSILGGVFSVNGKQEVDAKTAAG